jgi:phosphatidate cytidylyltransferase
MLRLRIISAIVGIPIVLLIIWAGGFWYAGALALLLMIATAEFHRHSPAYQQPLAIFSGLLVGLLAILPATGPGFPHVTVLLTLAAVLSLTWSVFRLHPETALPAWSLSLASVVYIGLLGSHLTALRFADDGRQWVLLAVLSTWITDTAAYCVGRTLGRHKLAPLISPGKTVEGAFGGFIAGAGAVAALHRVFALPGTPILIGLMAVIVPIVGQIGDLGESLLKRGLHVKDSSRLIPGHGGVLDRLDSIFFVGVAVYYLSRL